MNRSNVFMNQINNYPKGTVLYYISALKSPTLALHVNVSSIVQGLHQRMG